MRSRLRRFIEIPARERSGSMTLQQAIVARALALQTGVVLALLLLLTRCSAGDAAVGGAPLDAGDSAVSEATGVSDAPGATDAADSVADAGSPADAMGPACLGGVPHADAAPPTVDESCFVSTFDDEFQAYDVSSGPKDDGKYPNERWFNGTEQCCLSPSDGLPAVNYPMAGPNGPVNPYSLLPGGGLRISLQNIQNEWYSGVMTSIDSDGHGFSQKYGYFEMSARLPSGTGTWPSFWMLSVPGGPGGEIDIFEQYGCNPPLDPAVERIFHTTLHDWSAQPPTGTSYTANVTPDLTAAYHRYGLLWSATYIALYFDGNLLWSQPPLSTMNQPHYLLAAMGMGAGWNTAQTPN